MEKKFDSKWLKGLDFSYAETVVVEKNGRKTSQGIPKKRPLKEDDILAFAEYPDRIVIATKDGKKHVIKKNPAPVSDEKK